MQMNEYLEIKIPLVIIGQVKLLGWRHDSWFTEMKYRMCALMGEQEKNDEMNELIYR